MKVSGVICVAWGKHSFPSRKLRCVECKKPVALSFQTLAAFRRKGMPIVTVCVGCARDNHGDQTMMYMPGTAPAFMEPYARQVSGLPVSVATRFMR